MALKDTRTEILAIKKNLLVVLHNITIQHLYFLSLQTFCLACHNVSKPTDSSARSDDLSRGIDVSISRPDRPDIDDDDPCVPARLLQRTQTPTAASPSVSCSWPLKSWTVLSSGPTDRMVTLWFQVQLGVGGGVLRWLVLLLSLGAPQMRKDHLF